MKATSKMASSTRVPVPIATIMFFVCMGLIIFLAGQLTSRHLGTRIGGNTTSAVTEAIASSQAATKAATDAANAATAAAKEAATAANNAAAAIKLPRPTAMHVPATSNNDVVSGPSNNDVVSGNLKRNYFDYTEVVPKVFNQHHYNLCQLSDEASECWPPLTVDIDCKKLFQQYYGQMISHKSVSPVPNAIPEQEKEQYLLYGFSKLKDAYYNENFVGSGGAHATWDQALIDNKTRHGQLRTSPYATYVSAHVHVGLLPHHCSVERLVCS
jgi:hypothetical protein